MDKAYEHAKYAIVNFKLDRSCCFLPIRIGVLAVGYFNLFIAILSLLGTADGGVQPPLMEVQDQFLEDNASKAVGIMAYSAELGFSVLLLGGMYRNDIVLLRVYVYFVFAMLVTALLVYSMIIAAVSMLTKLVLIGNMVYNVYVILLVRSAIVEIKETRTSERNGHITLYSIAKVQESERIHDIEAPEPTETAEEKTNSNSVEEQNDDGKNDGEKPKLDTVNENVKEE